MSKLTKKVLVVVPTHESKRYSLKDCLDNLARQKFRDYRVLVVVNNSSPEFSKWVKKLLRKHNRRLNRMARRHKRFKDVFVLHDIGPVKGEFKGDILSSVNNYGTDYATSFDYEYTLIVGADICLPDRGISLLLEPFELFSDCGVSCLTCHYRMDMESIIKKSFHDGVKVNDRVPMIIMPPGSPDMTPERYYRATFIRALAGNGAMMYRTEVGNDVPWRHSYAEIQVGSDYQFCFDVRDKRGLWTYINTKIWTPHLDQSEEGDLVVI